MATVLGARQWWKGPLSKAACQHAHPTRPCF